MLLARVRARACGGPLRHGVLAVALVLIFALFVLGPLAYASPPDQTSVAGIYDAADYDDVVWLLTDTSMARECAQSADITCYPVPQVLASPCASVRLPVHHGSFNPRAPPIPETTR
jgi:hypothetical protein